MTKKRTTQRIRDAIHDIIVFDEGDDVDMAAWDLLGAPELQRLRRVKQLGVSEFVFPSATHSRFAHSLGVFNNARRLIRLIDREIRLKRVDGGVDPDRKKVAVFAALLHDIGHGPFSHAFEEARKSIFEKRAEPKEQGKIKIEKHEAFSARMIRRTDGPVAQILVDAKVNPDEVAKLIETDTPTDMFHAVISSSFDADRLDYLLRDRYMSGVGAGAIDLEWLMDNLRVADIDVSPAGDSGEHAVYRHSFCFYYKSRQAAEDFLLARYRLYANLYFHKTTRGIEQMISALFRTIAEVRAAGKSVTGLNDDEPLVSFFSKDGETLENYMSLDDTVVWGAIHRLSLKGEGQLRTLANRILAREKPLCLDVQVAFPEQSELQRRLKHKLDEEFSDTLGFSVFKDSAKLSIYGEIGADDRQAQKRLMIQLKSGELREITDFKDGIISGSTPERSFDRYYFLDEKDRERAEGIAESVGGKR